jgi:hypothetical protein
MNDLTIRRRKVNVINAALLTYLNGCLLRFKEQQHYWSDDPLMDNQGFSLLCRKRIKEPWAHAPPIPDTALHVP